MWEIGSGDKQVRPARRARIVRLHQWHFRHHPLSGEHGTYKTVKVLGFEVNVLKTLLVVEFVVSGPR